MVNNSINIIKTKESLNSDGQQFHQYHQNKRQFKQRWSTIPLISSKQKMLTITVYTFFCFDDLDGIVDHHSLNFLLF
jgi:hypothetical protein